MESTHREPRRVVVIGAGVAGLATAALLAREGFAVTVCEQGSEIGGRAGSFNGQASDGGGEFRWDTGPSWYLMPEAFDRFFRLCGTETAQQLELTQLDPAYRVYSETGDHFDLHSGPENVAKLFESLEPGAGRRVRDYLERSGEVYAFALAKFLYTTFARPGDLLHREILQRLPLLVRLLRRSLADEVAQVVKDYRLRQILSYPAVFLSTQPHDAPALYSLMSHTDLVQGVAYPRGGFHAVIAAIARQATQAGAEIRLNTVVEAVTTAPGTQGEKARVTGARVRTQREEKLHLPAEIVVSAADLQHTETELIPGNLSTYPKRFWQKRNPGLGTVLVMLGVRGCIDQLAHHTLLFSADWDPDFRAVFDGGDQSRPSGASRSIYVSKPSASDESVAPAGYENLFILIPTPAEENIGFGNAYRGTASPRVREIAEAGIDQLARWAGISDLRERIVACHTIGPADFAQNFNAWRAGAIGPAHTLRQSAFLRGKNTSSHIAGLLYAGATTVPGVGVPMCLISAENVLTRLREEGWSP